MHFPLDPQPQLRKSLHAGLFVLIGALVVLALGAATAFAADGEEGEGGLPPTEPVIVPEVETPVTPPVAVPEPNPAPSASPPAAKPSESAPPSSGSGSTRTPTTRSPSSSAGGSKPAPTTVNHNNVRSPSSSGTESTGGSGTGGSGGGSGSSPSSVEPQTSSPTMGTSAPTRNLEKVADDLAANAGQAPAKNKKDRQDAVARLGKALGTALLGKAAAVSHPKQDQGPVWVPLPGKSKLPYMLLILAVLALVALIVWTQFRGPRESRRRKALVDHRVGSAAGFTLAPGNYTSPNARPRPLRAAEADPNPGRPRREAPRRGTPGRAPRRKAA